MTTVAPVHYCIRCLDPNAHVFAVECTVDDPDPAGQRFVLPTWVPGSYLVREFARHFMTVAAHVDGAPVTIAKEAKDTWRAAPCAGPLTVVAEVYAFDLSVRTAYLDAARAYFNGACVFLCAEGRAGSACTLDIAAPTHAGSEAWRVATTLPRVASADAVLGGFGRFTAASYDALIDHPVEMGTFTTSEFSAGGAAHTLAVTGATHADLARAARDLARVCQAQCDLFGGTAPFTRYLFLTLTLPAGRGGLEHRDSTSLITARDTLPSVHEPAVTDRYVDFLGLASHEYFHSWNVKRIKPAAFVPYDLAHEGYTRQLWAFEGITSYYDDLMLARSGVIALERYLELVGRTATDVMRRPGRLAQSVAESSFDAWIKFYRQDENTPNAIVSYYGKGSLVALALDLTLRRHASSLDALMRWLWEHHGATGIGVAEDGIERAASALAGASLADFFTRYVRGTEDPPLAELLADVGIDYTLRAADSATDKGGTPGKARGVRKTTLGATWTTAGDVKLATVLRGGPAAQAGLSANDTLVAVDGIRATPERLERALAHAEPGDALPIVAFRNDALLAVTVTLGERPLDTVFLAPRAEASAATLARRHAWLQG